MNAPEVIDKVLGGAVPPVEALCPTKVPRLSTVRVSGPTNPEAEPGRSSWHVRELGGVLHPAASHGGP